MMGVFRYMYDRSYEHLNKHGETEWQFLAEVYVAADKYEIGGLTKNVTKLMKSKILDEGFAQAPDEDFLAAVKIVFGGTTSQDKIGRATMVDLCVYCIQDLNKMPEFEVLLSECGELGAKIIGHEKLSLMLEGTWYCGVVEDSDEEHKDAVPRCSFCGDEFSTSYILENRHKQAWECPSCDTVAGPICTDHDAVTGFACRWVCQA